MGTCLPATSPMTADLVFVDTNVLLYAASTAPEEGSKARVARGILEAEDHARISLRARNHLDRRPRVVRDRGPQAGEGIEQDALAHIRVPDECRYGNLGRGRPGERRGGSGFATHS